MMEHETAYPALDLEHVCRFYQSGETTVKALNDVSLKIWPGEFVAIMGQSGSGKSTLMNIIGCLDRTTDGNYNIFGKDVSHFDGDELATLRRETFGFIFQRYNLLATSTASENVEIPALYAGMNKSQRQTRAHTLLESLGMGDRGHHRPSELSGGQQQRVAIARALMNDPPVILADEPTGALDTRTGEDVMALLKQQHANGRTIILITHDEHVASHAHRIIRIQDGQIIEDVQQVQETIHNPIVENIKTGNAPVTASALEAVKIALNALRVNIFRTALTLLGIVIGVSSVIVMLAIGNGSKEKVLDQISSLGTNIISIRPGAPGIRSSGDNASFTMDDSKSLETIPNVEVVVPDRSIQKTLRVGNLDYATSVQGVGAAFPIARDWPLSKGNFFNEKDMVSYAPVIVLGDTVKNILFPDGDDPIGQYVLVGTIPFNVIGVMDKKGAAPWGGDQDDTAFVPITTGLIRLFGTTFINGVTVKVTDVNKIDQTEKAISDTLIARHGKEDFQVRNTTSFLEMITTAQNALTVLLGAVAAISLLVGGIGVMNIMLVSVTERTREIGIRIATGARMRDIMIQFNTEATVVCTIGGIVGVMIGFLAGWGISFFDVNILFTPGPAILAFTCAVLTGVLFGYLPARKAARLDPVVALSSE